LRISIITPTYNSSDFIEYAIRSVQAQDYQNVEHIIIDGGSTDATIDKIMRLGVDYFISEPDDGIYDALNKGLAASTGDIVGFLHADDFFSADNVLSCIFNTFSSDKSISGVYGDLAYVTRNNPNKIIRYWKSESFNNNLLSRGWMPPHPTLYIRKNLYDKVGNFNINYKISSDYDCILKLFTYDCHKYIYIPKLLVKMRLGGVSNKSIISVIRKSKEDLRILMYYNSNILICLKILFWKNFSKLKQFISSF